MFLLAENFQSDAVFESIQKQRGLLYSSIEIAGFNYVLTSSKYNAILYQEDCFNFLRWNNMPRTSRIFRSKIAIFSQF